MKAIVSMSAQNQYGNVASYQLYKAVPFTKLEVNAVIEEAAEKGYVTTRAVRNFVSITPTSKAYKMFSSARPVSKEVCLAVFKEVLYMESLNKEYWNVSYKDLSRICDKRVGAITFDNALAKLEKAKYINVRYINNDFKVISTTATGTKAYNKALEV